MDSLAGSSRESEVERSERGELEGSFIDDDKTLPL